MTLDEVRGMSVGEFMFGLAAGVQMKNMTERILEVVELQSHAIYVENGSPESLGPVRDIVRAEILTLQKQLLNLKLKAEKEILKLEEENKDLRAEKPRWSHYRLW